MNSFLYNRYIKYGDRLFFWFFRIWNKLRGRPSILLYTDSRGKNIPGHFHYRHYSKHLARKYSVEAHLCPEKWTTLLDFFDLFEKKGYQNYDLIILHASLVDFAPRHYTTFKEVVYPQKKASFDRIFGTQTMQAHLQTDLGVPYEGDKTTNMYSLAMAEQYMLPKLKAIPNLIWISGNRVVPNWLGNYWRPRPENLNLMEDYVHLFEQHLENVVSLMDWSLEEVKEYTYDIIHVNQKGSDIILQRVERAIQEYFNKQKT